MKNLDVSKWEVSEMCNLEMMNTEGQYSWKEFCGDAGYTVGYMVGAATNAAGIMGTSIRDILVGEGIMRAVK